MKIACSTASFERPLHTGALTQLEWLDLCANELEIDGVVFDSRHFPRTDAEYLAQLKKSCVDLGLSVAGLAFDHVLGGRAREAMTLANDLGAPLVAAGAPPPSEEPEAWGRFVEFAREAAAEGKRANVTLAVRNAPATMLQSVTDLKRLAKDVDSAWLRFAPDLTAFSALDATLGVVSKAVLAVHTVERAADFAIEGDPQALALARQLRRFRGFVLIERIGEDGPREAFHQALERFRRLRAAWLDAPAAAPAP
jgi:hypothetical protein